MLKVAARSNVNNTQKTKPVIVKPFLSRYPFHSNNTMINVLKIPLYLCNKILMGILLKICSV